MTQAADRIGTMIHGSHPAPRPRARFGASVGAAIVVLFLSTAAAQAQQTIIIGGDRPGGISTSRSDRSGVVVNEDALEALGSPGTLAPVPPLVSVPLAPVQVDPPLAPGTAYRLPGTGQLVVSRPSTLLFPPPAYLRSRLTVPGPDGAAARAALEAPSAAPSLPSVAKPAQPRDAAPITEGSTPSVAAVPRQPVTQESVPDKAPTEQVPVFRPSTPAPQPGVAEPTAPPPAATIAPRPEPTTPAEPPAAPALAQRPQATTPSQPPVAGTGDATASAPPATPAPSPGGAAPERPPQQTASLPPAGRLTGQTRVVFDDDSAELTSVAAGLLDGLARTLLENGEARVQILAYAKATADGSNRARRLSLSRALAVRAYLIEKGVLTTRMDVRALGSGFQDGPPDRVDILPQESAQ